MDNGQFTNNQGISIHTYAWKCSRKSDTGIIILHGYAEYTGRYKHVVDFFNDTGIHVFGFDYRGHGRSEGMRGFVESYQHLIDDADAFFLSLRESEPEINHWFLLGHSTGGAMAITLASRQQEHLKGVILTAPLIAPAQQPSALMVSTGRLIGSLLPSFPLLPFDTEGQCRDNEVMDAFYADPRNYKGRLRAGTGLQFLELCEHVQQLPQDLNVPFWIGHSSSDRITSFEAAQVFSQKIASEDVTFQKYDGLFHELLNEPEQRIILGTILSWIQKRIRLSG